MSRPTPNSTLGLAEVLSRIPGVTTVCLVEGGRLDEGMVEVFVDDGVPAEIVAALRRYVWSQIVLTSGPVPVRVDGVAVAFSRGALRAAQRPTDGSKRVVVSTVAVAGDAASRLVGAGPEADSVAEAVLFVEWLADQPCTGNGSRIVCRVNSPDDPSWCCHACRAFLIRYGRDPSRWAR